MTAKEFVNQFWHAVSDEKRLELVEELFKEGAIAKRVQDRLWVDPEDFERWLEEPLPKIPK